MLPPGIGSDTAELRQMHDEQMAAADRQMGVSIRMGIIGSVLDSDWAEDKTTGEILNRAEMLEAWVQGRSDDGQVPVDRIPDDHIPDDARIPPPEDFGPEDMGHVNID